MSSALRSSPAIDFFSFIKIFPDPCMLLTPHGNIVAASDVFFKVTGVDQAVIGKLIYDIFPDNPDTPNANSIANLRHSITSAYREKKISYLEMQAHDLPIPGGGFEERYWSTTDTPILDEEGDVVYILHKGYDVTEQVLKTKQIKDLTAQTKALLKQEQANHQEAERQRAYLYELLMQIPVAVTIFQGSDYVIELANEMMLHFWGRTSEQTVGKPVFVALPEVIGQGFEQILHKVFTSGEPYVSNQIPVLLNRGNGLEQVYFHGVYQPFRNIEGEITGVIAEVTEHIQAKTLLEQTMQVLQDRNFELDQFVYKTSHDLRSPLMSILGLVSLIKGEPLPDSMGQYVDLIENRVVKLDGFIKSTLDYSRNTRTAVNCEPIDWQALLTEILSSLELMKNFERLSISTHIQPGAFYSDTFRLRIILSNLISNAVKYQDMSKEVSYLKIKIEVNPRHALIHLEDNGVGIAQTHQDHIFDMFFRATEQSEGSGLGLYIVKQAITMLKGEVVLKSTAGKGTIFLITLPNLTESKSTLIPAASR